MMKAIKLAAILIFTVSILLGTFNLVSSVGVVPWFRISDIPYLQGYPAIAYNSTTDQYLAVWEDFRGDVGFGSDVYAQIVNSDSSMAGANFSITVVNDWQRSPKPAYNSVANKYLVVWQEESYDGKGDIYGRMVNANGTLSLAQFPIATAVEYQWNPDLVYNPITNQFLVVWQDDRMVPGDNDIYGQFVNADRTLSGNNFAISNPSTDQLLPSVAYNTTDNQYLVIWQDDRNPASDADIYGQVINGNGSLNGGNFAISTASANQDYPDIAYASSANRYLVVWEQSNDIYGRLVNANKTFTGPEFQIASSSGSLSNPTVSYNSQSNQFMVVWSDSYGSDDINAQLVGVDGSMPEPKIDLATQGQGDLQYPAITSNSSNNTFMIAWVHQTCHNEFDDCEDDDIDIFGAFYQASGHFGVYLPLLLRDYQNTIFPTATNTPPLPTSTPIPPSPTPNPWVNIVAEDFEGNFPTGFWSVLDDQAGSGEYYWMKRNCRAYGGSYGAWVVGGGADGSLLTCGSSFPGYVKSWMIYGPFNLADATEADLRFKAWINTGSAASLYRDFCRMASTDGVSFSGDCYRGNSEGWIDQTLDLSNVSGLGSLIGQPEVYIGLYFQNLTTAGYTEGVFVDDIVIRKCVSANCPTSAAGYTTTYAPGLTSFPVVKSLNQDQP